MTPVFFLEIFGDVSFSSDVGHFSMRHFFTGRMTDMVGRGHISTGTRVEIQRRKIIPGKISTVE